MLAIEMFVACHAEEFYGFGDGLVEGQNSAPSLIVNQLRLHHCGTKPAQWIFDDYYLPQGAASEDTLGVAAYLNSMSFNGGGDAGADGDGSGGGGGGDGDGAAGDDGST